MYVEVLLEASSAKHLSRMTLPHVQHEITYIQECRIGCWDTQYIIQFSTLLQLTCIKRMSYFIT